MILSKRASHIARVLRPKKFSDVVGQETSVKLIQKALSNDMMSQVCTIFGPSGIGKTTLARLIAMWQCCSNPTEEPCGECSNCKAILSDAHPDVFELDGGTYTGVENIKSMLENLEYKTSMSHKKVYIIDEAHMLSRHAISSLLKKFEEELVGVQFILATTDIDSLPDAIISRSFKIKLDPVVNLKDYLKKIADLNDYQIDDDSAECIEYIAEGSVREALSRLEQLAIMCDFKIDSKSTREVLGIARATSIDRLIEILENGTIQELSKVLIDLQELQPIMVLKQLVRKIRDRILEGKASEKLLNIGKDLVEASILVTKSRRALEICLGYAMVNNKSS